MIGAMVSKPPRPALEACAEHIWENLGDPYSYPGLEAELERLVTRISLAVLGKKVSGWATSGATEANILAALYWRERGYRRVVHFNTAHYSVSKAARLLGMEELIVPYGDRGLAILERELGPRDIVFVTYGTTQEGWIEPIREVAELARKRGAKVHVDAAYAGFIAAGLKDTPRIELDDTVATLAVDLHKIPEAPMPLGLILASSEQIIDSMFYRVNYIPSGRQFGILGSRPGCPVYGAHVSLRYLETLYGGPEDIASLLMRLKRTLVSELGDYGFNAIESPTPVACLVHPDIDRIVRILQRAGTKLYMCPRHRGARIALMPHHDYLGELRHIISCLSEASRKSMSAEV